VIEPTRMTTTRFRVGKMDCAAEEQLVRMRLDAVAGIRRVDIDLANRTVAVDHEGTVGEIASALDSLDLDSTELDEHTLAEPLASVDPRREHRALLLALGINASFFFGEFIAGVLSRSLGLIADALDMGADASVYALSLFAVGRSATRKRRLAATSGYLQLGLAIVGLAAVVRRFVVDVEPPEVSTMIVMSLLALGGNIATIVVLHRVRSSEAHIQASWIFTANDIKVNLLVILAAAVIAVTDSAAPDLVAGAVIFVIVANGARRILSISRA
jgi:Co/Zn/Cd efflux system component